jgi:phage shock protein A
MRRILSFLAVLAGLVMPDVAAAQRIDDRAQFEARINVLQRSLSELSAQIEQLKVRDQQLQQQLDNIRGSYDQRLQRLERETTPKPVPLGRSKP